MKCDYYDRGECLSCTHLITPYLEQVEQRQHHAAELLGVVPTVQDVRWLPPATSASKNYRTKAKMAVGGTSQQPTLGLLNDEWQGIDLSACPILHPHIRNALPALRQFIIDNRIEPYDVSTRKGELKYILITADTQNLEGGLLIRFVLRSRANEALLRSRLPRLLAALPQARVVTINLHPQHAAVVEGVEELILTEQPTLPMTVGDVRLHVGPRSFTQTNTDVAGELYRQVAHWANIAKCFTRETPEVLWDLYCGVGGFALHAACAGVPHVVGVEISDAAIDSARLSAKELFGDTASQRTKFVAEDATAWVMRQTTRPDIIVVNPPRRGIGTALAAWLNESGPETVVYSSCNPRTLAKDLQNMPHYHCREARLFDMFPHTDHAEVAVLLERA